MKENCFSGSGVFRLRVTIGLALPLSGAFLAMFALAANPTSGTTGSGEPPPGSSIPAGK